MRLIKGRIKKDFETELNDILIFNGEKTMSPEQIVKDEISGLFEKMALGYYNTKRKGTPSELEDGILDDLLESEYLNKPEKKVLFGKKRYPAWQLKANEKALENAIAMIKPDIEINKISEIFFVNFGIVF